MTLITNFFIVPSGLAGEPLICKSGNSYTAVNNIITNVATGDILDIIGMGCRQVGGPDSAATLAWVAGRFYNPVPGSTPGTFQLVASTIYAFPFRTPANIPIQTLSVDVTTAGQATSAARFALYTDLNGAPSTQVAGSESGSQVMTSTGGVTYTPASPLSLNEGWYWAAIAANSLTTMPTLASIATGYASSLNSAMGQDTLAHAIAASGEAAGGVSATFVYGSLPQSFPTASYAQAINAGTPLIVLGT